MWRDSDFWRVHDEEWPGKSEQFRKGKVASEQRGCEYLHKLGILDWIDDIREASKSSGTKYYNLATLWYLIEIHKPKYFLELGTGVSTHVIARAMSTHCKHDDLKLISMEHDELYYDDAIKNKPDCDFLEIIRSDICLENVYSFLLAGYKDIPYLPYSMVFVDGPPQDTFVSGDLLWVIANAKDPILGIIDQRAMTALVYYILLGPKYIKRFGTATFQIGPIEQSVLDYRKLAVDVWKRAEVEDRMYYLVEGLVKHKDILAEEDNDI